MMRRNLLGLPVVLAMTSPRGDKLRRPQNAPNAQGTPIGVQPGTQSITIAHIIIVTGPGGGVFIYSGTPGPGNPPIAWISNGTTDPYGNALPEGAQMGLAGTGTFTAGDTIINSSGTFVYSGAPANGNLFLWIAGNAGTDSFGNPFTQGFGTKLGLAQTTIFGGVIEWLNGASLSGASSGAVVIDGTAGTNWINLNLPLGLPLTAVEPGTTATAETWHSLGALGAGSGYTVNSARYRLTTDGETEIDVNLTAGAATVAGTYVFANALPAAYRPLLNCSYPMGWNGTVTAGMNFPSLRPVSATGLVNLQLPALPNGTVISCTQRIPTN